MDSQGCDRDDGAGGQRGPGGERVGQARAVHEAELRQVKAPGVPSLQSDGRHWYLYFAGYAPHQAKSGAVYPASRRMPFYEPLKVSFPGGASVAGTSPFKLSTWIEPKQRGGGASACEPHR